jgi:xanthine dehydrogenase YagT iron-sulfur-binding subunit
MIRHSPTGARPPSIGDEAPDFVLPTGAGSSARLRDLRGAPVVLAFHAGAGDGVHDAWARVCEEIAAERLEQQSVRVLSLSSEAHDAIARRYGVADAWGVFVLDEQGRIARRHLAGDAVPDPIPSAWSRREFIAAAIGAAVAFVLSRPAAAAEPTTSAAMAPPETGDAPTIPVTLHVNGRDIALDLDARVTLLDALRDYAGITGPKKGCDHGQCGACTVHVDGRRVLSCLTFAAMQQGREITTIEGLATNGELHPIQRAFIEHDGFQCGYCTSGQIMSAVAMLREPWGDSDDDVREAMSGNICRCGAYPGIVAAIQQARGIKAADR